MFSQFLPFRYSSLDIVEDSIKYRFAFHGAPTTSLKDVTGSIDMSKEGLGNCCYYDGSTADRWSVTSTDPLKDITDNASRFNIGVMVQCVSGGGDGCIFGGQGATTGPSPCIYKEEDTGVPYYVLRFTVDVSGVPTLKTAKILCTYDVWERVWFSFDSKRSSDKLIAYIDEVQVTLVVSPLLASDATTVVPSNAWYNRITVGGNCEAVDGTPSNHCECYIARAFITSDELDEYKVNALCFDSKDVLFNYIQNGYAFTFDSSTTKEKDRIGNTLEITHNDLSISDPTAGTKGQGGFKRDIYQNAFDDAGPRAIKLNHYLSALSLTSTTIAETDFTIDAWVKVNSTGNTTGAKVNIFRSVGDAFNNDAGYGISINDTSDTIRITLNGSTIAGSGTCLWELNNTIHHNDWIHIFITGDNVGLVTTLYYALYSDATITAHATTFPDAATIDDLAPVFLIGEAFATENCFLGDVVYYTRILTAGEMLHNHIVTRLSHS